MLCRMMPLLLATFAASCTYVSVPDIARLEGLNPERRLKEIEAAKLILESRDLMSVHEWASAKHKLFEARSRRAEVFGSSSLAVEEVNLDLGTLYIDSGDLSQAVKILHTAGQNLLKNKHIDSLLHSELAFKLAMKFGDLSLEQYSDELLTLSVKLRSDTLGSKHILTKISQYWLRDQEEVDALNDQYFEKIITEILEAIENETVGRNILNAHETAMNFDRKFFQATLRHARWVLIRRWVNQGKLSQIRAMVESMETHANALLLQGENIEAYSLYYMIGDIYTGLKNLKLAHKNYEIAYELIEKAESNIIRFSPGVWAKNYSSVGSIRRGWIYSARSNLLADLAKWPFVKKRFPESEQYLRWAIASRLMMKENRIFAKEELYSLFLALGHLGCVYWQQDKHKLAENAWYDALDIFEENFRRLSADQTEALLLRKIRSSRSLSEEILDLIRPQKREEGIENIALASLLLTQGRVADVVAAQNASLNRSNSVEEDSLRQKLRTVQLQLSSLEWSNLPLQNSFDYRTQKRHLEESVIDIKQRLNSITPNDSSFLSLPWSREIVQQVARKIPENAILINYVNYWHREQSSDGSESYKRNYLALLLRADGIVTAVVLGDAKSIEQSIARFRQELVNPASEYRDSAHDLYKKIVEPLRRAIGPSRRLLIVPDGQLHEIPFEILHDGVELLGDSLDIDYLSSGRDLLWKPAQSPGTNVVVFANPELNATPEVSETDVHGSAGPYQRLRTAEVRRSPRGIKFGALPSLRGAEIEASDIARLFPGTVLNFWLDASEQNLFRLRNPPGILHFSTHGLFLREKDTNLGLESRKPLTIEFEPAPVNPLLRSMLLLAGAAQARSSHDASYDGIATALEISTLPLFGTQMVVLSACESGLGGILPGEGVEVVPQI